MRRNCRRAIGRNRLSEAPGREAFTTRCSQWLARWEASVCALEAPRWLSFSCKCAGWLLATVAVALLALFFVLSRGPITFDSLAPKLVEALDEQFSRQFRFKLTSAAIANASHGPTLSVEGLTVERDGKPIFTAPRAEVSVELRSLLLGRIRLRRVETFDLELRLSVMPDGAMAISAGGGAVVPLAPPSAGPAPTPSRSALIVQAAGALRGVMDFATSPNSAIGALDRVGIAHGRLVIDDKSIGRVFRYEDFLLSLDKDRGGMRFAAAATGAGRRWTALAAASGSPGGRREFAAQIRDASIDEIALAGGFRNLKFDTDAPLSLDGRFVLDRDDRLSEASGHFALGKGFFRLEEPDHEPVMLDTIAGDMTWSKATRKLTIAPLVFRAGGFDMALGGEIAAPLAESPRDAWRVSIDLRKPTRIAPERSGEQQVTIEKGRLAGRLLADDKKFVIESFEFSGPDATVSLSGAVGWAAGPRITYGLDVTDTQIRALTRLWPTHVAPPVRNWFLDHVTAGIIRHGSYSADFDSATLAAMRYERPPPDGSVKAEVDVADASIAEGAPGLPPFTNVAGKILVTGRTAQLIAHTGAMDTAPGHHLTVSEAKFVVPDNGVSPTPASLDIHLAGGAEAVADLLAIPSIAAHARLPIDPETIRGQVDGHVHLDFDMGGDRLAVAVEAAATNMSIERFAGKEKLDGASLTVASDRAGLRVNGTGKLFGAPVALEVKRAAGEKGAAQAQLLLQFDEAARQKAGYAIPGVSGQVAALVKTQLPIETTDMQVELDLTRTQLDNPLPGIVKPVGRSGKASFSLARRSDGATTLEQLVFDAGAAQAQGVVELGRDGGWKSAKLSQMRLSPGDEMRVEATRGPDATKITVRGANFDARAMLKTLMQGGAERSGKSGPGDDLDIDLKSPIVTGYGKQILSNVAFHLSRRGGQPRALSLTGKFGSDELAVALLRNQNGAPQMEISTSDAGSFLAFMDLYQKMGEGVLNASVQLGDHRADGILHIRDFSVRREPAMRQLMAQGGATDRNGVRLDPDTVRVGKLQASFGWADGRLALREGVMSGPDIGLTFDGWLDFAHDRLDLGGAYVPAYALNSLLSNIPVLGVVIAGGQNEGIFALNYHVTGVIGSPTIVVNPLSAIAPGLMRKILGVLDGSVRPPDNR